MKAKLNAIQALRKYLNQSEADRLKPKPQPPVEQPEDKLSDEANEALMSLAKEG